MYGRGYGGLPWLGGYCLGEAWQDVSPAVVVKCAEWPHEVDGALELMRAEENIIVPSDGFNPERLFVATVGGEVVGAGYLEVYENDDPMLRAFVVAPSLRDKGIGRKLMDLAVKRARLLGYKRVRAITARGDALLLNGFRKTDLDVQTTLAGICRLLPDFDRMKEYDLDLTKGGD